MMVFSDLFFLFVFIPIFIVCYLLGSLADKKYYSIDSKKRNTVKNLVLVVFSLIFYAWGEPVYVFLMLICVLINYVVGICIGKHSNKRKLFLVIGLVGNIVILATFKYLGFLFQILTDLGISVSVPSISLPIGISFYVFQSISYLIDVYRKDSPVQQNFMNLLLYISMFPQLIAGPIVRYGTVATEIHNRRVTVDGCAEGVYRFFIGLGKKVFLANQLSEISDQFLVDGLHSLSVSGAWIGLIAFTLQIYFDFSGYSDMAIGMGRCLGFHFNENFNHPYCCNSVTDFWRRWHMSLGSFFRDYVYIPMGGNRKRQSFNILTVWFLTGMWHGASWNFIIWGLYFGLIIMIEKYTVLRIQHKLPSVLLHSYSMLLVIIGWGIFYFEDFHSMHLFFSSIIGNNVNTVMDFMIQNTLLNNFWIWIIALLFCLPMRQIVSGWIDKWIKPNSNISQNVYIVGHLIFSLVALVVCTALLVGATNNAFIYTRF